MTKREREKKETQVCVLVEVESAHVVVQYMCLVLYDTVLRNVKSEETSQRMNGCNDSLSLYCAVLYCTVPYSQYHARTVILHT